MGTILYQSSFFKPLTSEITIEEGDNVSAFSLKVVSGTCTIQGSAQFQGEASDVITLSEGDSYTKVSTGGAFLSGYTITPVGGTTNIDISK